MAPSPAENALKVQIPNINWAADKFSLIWDLLAEVEKSENYHVLLGKKDTSKNTSGETKVKVYNWIAEAILPDLFKINANTVRDRVKSKLEALIKTYRRHAARLRKTGEGVKNADDSQGHEETLEFYITGEGPCVETPPHVVNIWKQIEKEFIFFPALHRIFASRPNVTPIVVTTGIGPQGRKTVWLQPPDDDHNIDPRLVEESENMIRARFQTRKERSFGSDAANAQIGPDLEEQPRASQGTENVNTLKTPPGSKRGPKTSSASREAIENARKLVSKLPQKRSLADTMLEIQRENLAAQKDQRQSQLNIELRKQIMVEYNAGFWTLDQARKKLEALENPNPPSPKRRKKQQVSPDWDSDIKDVIDQEL